MDRMFGGMLVASAIAFFVFSLPRGGKLARFVGQPWESPTVLGAVCALAVGFSVMLFGTPNFLRD